MVKETSSIYKNIRFTLFGTLFIIILANVSIMAGIVNDITKTIAIIALLVMVPYIMMRIIQMIRALIRKEDQKEMISSLVITLICFFIMMISMTAFYIQ